MAEKNIRKKKTIHIRKKRNTKDYKLRGLSELEIKKLEMKKQRRYQKVKRKLIIFLFFIFAFAVTITIFKAPFFNIKGVVCVGQEKLTEEEILSSAKVVKGKNIFITNLKDVKDRLSKIPYVSESNARRIFPDKIKIWVRECTPAFAIKNGNNFAICDVHTKVLEISDKNETPLCIVSFPETAEIKEGNMLLDEKNSKNLRITECIKNLDKLNMLKLTTAIDFTDISDIIILYDNRLKIKLGDTDDIEYKLKFISEVITNNIAEHERATVDYTGEKLYVGQFEEEKTDEKVENTAFSNEDKKAKEEKESTESQKANQP